MYKFFIGVDISKDFFDVSYYLNGKSSYLGSFANEREGFNQMLKSLKTKTSHSLKDWFVCFENTGVYSKHFKAWLMTMLIPCKEECPLQLNKSMGIRRGKTDVIDSGSICLYAYERKERIKADIPTSRVITRLSNLLSKRNFLVRQRTSLINRASADKRNIDEQMAQEFAKLNEDLKEVLDTQIKEIEQLIKQTIASSPAIKKNNKLIQSVVGIGPIIAWTIIATTKNFSCFDNARKLASFCGIAPFPNQSGNWKGKTTVSKYANRKLKSLISNGVTSAIQHDPQIRDYYARKTKEGKPHGLIANAIKNKLIQRAFAVVKRQSPYVKISSYL